MTLPSSSSILACIPCECLSGLSSPWFHLLLLWVLLHACRPLEGSGTWRARGQTCQGKFRKKRVKYLSLFHISCHRIPCPTEQCPFSLFYILISLLSATGPLKETFLIALSSLASLNWSCTLAFLTVFLHTWTASVHSSQVVCPCSHLLCTSCVWAQAGAPCSSMLALCHTCSTFWTLCAVLVFWGGCLWRSASSPGAFCPAAQFSMNRLPEQT